MIGREGLHVAEKVNGARIAPFDPNHLGPESRQDTSGLRTDL